MSAARVLFLLSHFHKGGMQRAVSNISQSLPAAIDLHVGYFGSDAPGYPLRARVHDFGLPARSSDTLLGKALNAMRRLRALNQYVASNEIETVVSFGESANLYNLLAVHSARKVISIRVAIEEQLDSEKRFAPLLRRLVGVLYPRADGVVCVSDELARRARLAWPGMAGRIVVINNLYRLDAVREQAAESLPPAHAHLLGARYVLTVGSLVHQKGHDLLLEAFASKQIPADVRLVLLGSGELRDELIRKAADLGIGARCDFIDFDPNPYRYMARAAVFVLPSRFEGFPNVLVEAMACGAPVVAFDCPTGPKEILGEGEFGILVRPMSAAALRAAIGEILGSADERHRYCKAALRRSEDYGTGRIADRWTSLLAR